MSVSFCLPYPVAVSVFMICRGLCVLYVSFGSKVRPIAFGCIAMGSALLCILARIFCRVRREQSASCFVWI